MIGNSNRAKRQEKIIRKQGPEKYNHPQKNKKYSAQKHKIKCLNAYCHSR